MQTRHRVLGMLAEGRSQADVARALGLSKSTVAYHARRIKEPDPRFRRRYDWPVVQAFYDLGHTVEECVAHFGFSRETWHAAKNRGALITREKAMSIEQLLAGCRNRTYLKRRLIVANLLPNHCQSCGLSAWRGHPLSLELHHVNGDGTDNRIENLQILCPNCHSQTDSWGGKNSKRARARALSPPPARPRSARSAP